MSEAELLETVTNYHSLAMGAMVFYLSIVTAYIIAARFVGAELTRSQVTIITGLFVVFSSFAVWGSTAYFLTGTHFLLQTEAYRELRTEELVSPHLIVAIAEIIGILAGLRFMWDIRSRTASPRREE